jgi:hypothetical protein
MTQGDPMMNRIMAAIVDNSDGGDGQRARFAALWSEIGEDGDPLHRCTLAHYAADVESDSRTALLWNQRSLDAVRELSDERLQTTFPTLTVAGFMPSLHLNLAQDYQQLGEPAKARSHLDAAEDGLSALSEEGYGAMMRRGIDRLRRTLEGAG